MNTNNRSMTFNASFLRIILTISLLLIMAGATAAFVLAYQHLSTYATEISHRKIDAEASSNSVSSLQAIERRLEESKLLISKVDRLRADNSSPNPKFVIVDEVQVIADRNNVSISSFSYGETSSDAATPGQTTPSTPTTPTAQTNNSKVVALTANIRSPVNYRNYLQFLYDIEQNLPKMQIKGVGVSIGSGTQSEAGAEQQTQTDGEAISVPRGSVNVEPLVIEMYIK